MFTAHKRSLRRLCFYRCLSVHGGGACVVTGGMHGDRGHVWLQGACGCRGHAWLWGAWLWGAWLWGAWLWGAWLWGCAWLQRACMVVGGVPGCWGACMVGGCAWWQEGVHGIRQDTVNERVVRILLECILVFIFFSKEYGT